MSLGLFRLLDEPGRARRVPRIHYPHLTVAWEPRARNFSASLRAVFSGPKTPKGYPTNPFLRDAWVIAPIPQRALFTSALWHVAVLMVVLLVPFPVFRHRPGESILPLPQIELTWYGPVRDLPSISLRDLPGPLSKPSPRGEPQKPLPRRGANAFHPRQTIITAPHIPTHPRQTLIRPNSRPEPPKILPALPNVVQWTAPQVARPQLRISRAELARLRPKPPTPRSDPDVPIPEVSNLEKQVGPINIANTGNVPKPQLPMGPLSVPRVGPRAVGEAAPPPEIGPNAAAGWVGAERMIALSASPTGSATDLPPPPGNLVANISISPEGPERGVPGGAPNGVSGSRGEAGGGSGNQGGTGGAAGTNAGTAAGDNGSAPAAVSISGGNSNHSGRLSGLGSGAGTSGRLMSATPLSARPEPRPVPVAPNRTAPAPGFEHLTPGAPPEAIFGPKPVYTLHMNMPNLASATGSWILSFTELNAGDENGGKPVGTLSGPVPLRKVDPKYPPALAQAKVEGEVVVYAVIRRDGSVDSIQLVRGLDPQLDSNAMQALARWKFHPAERRGSPVELEAIVHIPFRAVAPLY